MNEHFVRSEFKPPGRRIWSVRPKDADPCALFVFLDAELYLERVSARQVVQHLQDQKSLPVVASMFVSSDSPAARHSDYVCDEGYTRFLIEDVLPFASQELGVFSNQTVIIGLSLSGLAAAHAAVTTERFCTAVCQSPSFWWRGERFTSSLGAAGGRAAAFWISVGDLETESGVSHPLSDLLQVTSQRNSCERGVVALRDAGYVASERVFHGGHDPVCWREDLSLALPWALQGSET